ncbi:hypothetical protein EAF00_000982 [Botryotinia globosa]|nr:hypothetical protein EAF00_000982 [Botryotinia globosa]
MAQNRGICGAEFPAKEPSPHFHHERTLAVQMRDVPVTKTPSSPETSSQRTLHALTPPPFDYTQLMESSLDESNHAGCNPEKIEDKFNVPYGVDAQGNWYGTVPTPGARTDEYMSRAENLFEESNSSDVQRDENRDKHLLSSQSDYADLWHAPTPGNDNSPKMEAPDSPFDEQNSFNTEDSYTFLPPPTPPNMKPDLSLWDSKVGNTDPGVENAQIIIRLGDAKGCEKIEKDCQAGNLPENAANRAKYHWRMLSQAIANFNWLHLDETMDKVPAVLAACCIYIACRQCEIPRTFIAIRVLTETSSLEYRQSVAKSFEIIQKYIVETKCSCLRAFRAPSEGCCQICHRLEAFTTARNSVIVKSNAIEKIGKTSKLCDDQSQIPDLVMEELKTNSIDSKMVKWVMKRCRNLKKRQDEDIAKVLAPVPHDFLVQIQDAENATIKLLKENHRTSWTKFSKAQEVYLTALQTDFLQFNMQSNFQGFLARLQQANKTSGSKRDRSILDPSEEASQEFNTALMSCDSKIATERFAGYADWSSKPRRGHSPQHLQVVSTGTQRSSRYSLDSELEEGEIQEYPKLKFGKVQPGMR